MNEQKVEVHEAEVMPPEDTAPKTQGLVTQPLKAGLVARPVVSPKEAQIIMAEWEELKNAIATEKDIRREKRSVKNADGTWGKVDVAYYKKSYWRKLSTFLGLKVKIVSERNEILGQVKLAHVFCEAVEPSGRSVIGDGHCGSDEGGKSNWTWANLMATANTRAFNRAVSNLVGGGEVSAEEIDDSDGDFKPQDAPQAPKPAPVTPKSPEAAPSQPQAPQGPLWVNVDFIGENLKMPVPEAKYKIWSLQWDGLDFTTFDSKIGQVLEDAARHGQKLKVRYEVTVNKAGKTYHNIKEVSFPDPKFVKEAEIEF